MPPPLPQKSCYRYNASNKATQAVIHLRVKPQEDEAGEQQTGNSRRASHASYVAICSYRLNLENLINTAPHTPPRGGGGCKSILGGLTHYTTKPTCGSAYTLVSENNSTPRRCTGQRACKGQFSRAKCTATAAQQHQTPLAQPKQECSKPAVTLCKPGGPFT